VDVFAGRGRRLRVCARLTGPSSWHHRRGHRYRRFRCWWHRRGPRRWRAGLGWSGAGYRRPRRRSRNGHGRTRHWLTGGGLTGGDRNRRGPTGHDGMRHGWIADAGRRHQWITHGGAGRCRTRKTGTRKAGVGHGGRRLRAGCVGRHRGGRHRGGRRRTSFTASIRCDRSRNRRTRHPAQPLGDVVQVLTGGGGSRIGRLHFGIHLSAMYLDTAWSFDTETYRVAPDIQDDDADVVTDHDAFPGAACQDQHCGLLPWTPPKATATGRYPGRRQTCGQLQAVMRC